jgi:hypothetical protein
VRQLIAENTEGRDLGVFGEPRVHVLKLNIALDALRVERAARSAAARTGVSGTWATPRCCASAAELAGGRAAPWP